MRDVLREEKKQMAAEVLTTPNSCERFLRRRTCEFVMIQHSREGSSTESGFGGSFLDVARSKY